MSKNSPPPNTTELTLQALLTEYNTLRQESLTAITNRLQLASVAFGAMSVMVAGLLARQLPDAISGVLALFIVPQIAKAALLIWLGEYHRSQRAGRSIASIEERINYLLCQQSVLTWEGQLANRRRHMSYPYTAVVFLILGSGFVSSAIGVYFLLPVLQKYLPGVTAPIPMLVLVIYSLLAEACFLVYFRKEWFRSIR